MGIWESLQWTAEAGRRGLADPAAAAIGCAGQAAGAAAGAGTAIVGAGRAVGEAAGGAIGGAGRAVAAAAGVAMGGAGQAAGAAAGAATAIVGTGRAVGAAAGGAIGHAGRAVGAAAGAAIGGTGRVVGTAAEKVGAGASEGARRIKGAMPDREGWGTICRIAWRVTDYALAEFTRPYTCGIPVYRYLREELEKGGADNKQKKDRKQEVARRTKSKEGAEKPEDVIENFMTSGFRGGGFINQSP